MKKVTVADSIAYLNDLLEYFRRKEISFNEMLLQTSKEALARWESRGLQNQIVTDNYKSEVAKYEHILDSVKNTTPDWV